jgi:UDP-N-acetylmuramate--alanine ligase
VKFIDDYAHNPQKISAALATARQVVGNKAKVIAVVQPHRYTRLRDSFKDFSQCFKGSDIVYISEVYAADEKPIKDINTDSLIKEIVSKSLHKNVKKLDSPNDLPDIVRHNCKSGDIVIFLGAGTITKWAYDLPKALQRRQ